MMDEYMTVTLENIAYMTGDYCTKFRAAVRNLNGYNVQGVYCFDCRVDRTIYRIYGGSDSFTVRLWEVM